MYNCWNLCREVYRRAGRDLPIQSEYIKRFSRRHKFIDEVKNKFFKRLDKPEFLAIVTLKMWPRCITHMGCVIDSRRFIHINKKSGVMLTKLDDRKWKPKIEGFYRYAGHSDNN